MTRGASPQLYQLRDILTALLNGDAPLTKELGGEAFQLCRFLTDGELDKLDHLFENPKDSIKKLTRFIFVDIFTSNDESKKLAPPLPGNRSRRPRSIDIDQEKLRKDLQGLLEATNAVIKDQEGVLPQAISLAQKEVSKIASPQIKEAWDKAEALKATTGLGRISIARELNEVMQEMLTPASQAKIFGEGYSLSGEV